MDFTSEELIAALIQANLDGDDAAAERLLALAASLDAGGVPGDAERD